MNKGGESTIVNIIALAQALFYLMSVPVNLAVRVNGLRAGTGLSIFEWRLARKRAEDDLSATERPGGKGPDPRRALRVLRRLRADRLELTGRVALGDAALTALLCGGINALALSLRGRVRHMRADIRPDFDSEGVSLELYGMLRARSGQIILATLQVLTEEAFSWTGTRLKT